MFGFEGRIGLAIYDGKCGWLDGERRGFGRAMGSGIQA